MGMHTRFKPVDEANEKVKDSGLKIVHFSQSRNYHIYFTNRRITTVHTVRDAIDTLNNLVKKLSFKG